MTDFGDYDPDDAYDATDPVLEQLRQLTGRLAWIVDHQADLAARVQRLIDDVATIRQRIIDGDL